VNFADREAARAADDHRSVRLGNDLVGAVERI
jgi:hypothetical protein